MSLSIEDRILARVRKDLTASKVNAEIQKVLSLNERELSFLVNEIIRFEGRAVASAFKNKEDINIPALGTFKYQSYKDNARPIIDDLLHEYELDDFSEIYDSPHKDEIMQRVRAIKSDEAYKEKLRKHIPRRPIILNDFKPKK